MLKLGWKELPGSKTEAAYASGMFSKSGFVVSVSTSRLAQLTADGWNTNEDTKLDARNGNVTLTRGQQRNLLTCVDTGVTDVNMMLIAVNANLEGATAKPADLPAEKPTSPKSP